MTTPRHPAGDQPAPSRAGTPGGAAAASPVVPSGPPPALIGLLPRHDLGEELGHGGFGHVYAARNRDLGRDEAVKCLSPDWLADDAVRTRFRDEGRALALLDHSHIVHVYQAPYTDDVCALVMERLAGGSLDRRFRAGLTRWESCAVVLGVLAALEYAHTKRVLHRDIKPENILFTRDGQPKVVDFGIARILGGSETLATRSGRPAGGTPEYMAPEQARGESALEPACDVYAVGVVLFELLSGERLHVAPGGNRSELLRRRGWEPARPVPAAVPAPLAAVVRRALELDPVDRYPRAEEFAVALARAGTVVFGPDWHQRAEMALHLSDPVRHALAQAADDVAAGRLRSLTTARISMERILPPLVEQRPSFSPPGPERGRDTDDRPVPVRLLVNRPPVRRWPAVVAAGCAVAAAALALLGPGAAPAAAGPGGGDSPRIQVAGAGTSGIAHLDLSDPVAVAGDGPSSAAGGRLARVRLSVSAGGVPLGEAVSEPFSISAGQPWSTTLTLRSWTRYVAGGAVRGKAELVDAPADGRDADRGGADGTSQEPLAASEVTLEPVQHWYSTAMGYGPAVVLLVVMFTLAEGLRAARRFRAGWFAAARMVVPGALLGAAGWLLLSVTLDREPRLSVGVGCLLLTTVAAVSAALAARPAR